MVGMDCSSGKKSTQSFTHDLDELVGKSRDCVWYSLRWKEEGRINWYPWGVQIYGYELAVARVGPGVGRMLEKTQLRGDGMETRINAKC